MPLFSTARTKASSTNPLSSSPTKPRKLFRRQGKHRPSPTSALAPINLNYYDRPEEKTGPDFFEKYRVNVVDVTSDKPSLVQTFDPPRDEPNWFLTSPPPREQNLEPPQSQPRALRGAQKPRSSSPKPPPSEPRSRAVYCQIDGNQNSERDWRPLSEEKDEDSLEGPNRDPHPLDRVNVRLLSRYVCFALITLPTSNVSHIGSSLDPYQIGRTSFRESREDKGFTLCHDVQDVVYDCTFFLRSAKDYSLDSCRGRSSPPKRHVSAFDSCLSQTTDANQLCKNFS